LRITLAVLTLNRSITVANIDTCDVVAARTSPARPPPFSTPLFEKTISNVIADFVNSGTLDVLNGREQFSGGFTK